MRLFTRPLGHLDLHDPRIAAEMFPGLKAVLG